MNGREMRTVSLSDLDRFGFDQAEITSFLAKNGINIGGVPEGELTLTTDSFPAWKRVMSLLPTLSEHEAASAFVGVDLDFPNYLSGDDKTELSRWRHVLVSAIRVKELIANQADFDSDQASHWAIRPSDLASWCSAKGVEYPLPFNRTLPVTDAGLRAALAECERQRAQWKLKADAVTASKAEREALQAEIDRLRVELRDMEDTLARLISERDALKVDSLAGKTKTTTLKIIGGVAKEAYRIKIHSDRLNGIGEMVSDLQKAGAGVDDKTLRTYIKESAKVIDPPQPA